MTTIPTTLHLGTFKTKSSLIKAVKAKHKISDWAKDLINSKDFQLSPKQTVELIETTVKELTDKNYPTTTEIFAAMETQGYEKCPDDTALYLRMLYDDQPMNEWISVMSKPIADSDGDLSVLSVGRNSYGSYVSRHYAYPVLVWHGDDQLWVCRKSLPLGSLPVSDPCALGSEITLNGIVYVAKENTMSGSLSHEMQELILMRGELMSLSNKISGYLRKGKE